MTAPTADNLVARGAWGEVRYAVDAHGELPASTSQVNLNPQMSQEISFADQFAHAPERAKLLHQEETVLEVTEMICELMESLAINRADLAKSLGKSKGHVSQLLDGKANMTLKTLANILFVLKCRLVLKAVKVDGGSVVYESDPAHNRKSDRNPVSATIVDKLE